jgi:predicted amidophosphoribosyltransferase
LSREQRETNLRDALWVDPLQAPRIQGRTVALIDDVMTTGASANAAAHALRQAGATQVQVWVVARTPRVA